ncbi:MAG TPA: glycosyltransferase [Thermoanaerobaculia bacterium]|nr:glycosyltransferase [Thermoanaerobaculia bacterium]
MRGPTGSGDPIPTPAARVRTTLTVPAGPELQRTTKKDSEPRRDPQVRGAIAVLMLRFPHLADTFVLREINELERQGQPVVVVPALEGQRTVIHEEAKPWISRALFTPLLSWAILRSNLAVFLRKPAAYLRVLFTLIGGTIVRPSTLLRTLALFPKSVHLSVVLPERGVRHLHAHFATHATTMAYIISSLTGLTYSFTVHGPDVFVHRLLLREKIRKATAVRAVSIFNKAFLSGLYPEETAGKIEVVRTGVNPDVYADAVAAARAAAATRPNPRPLVLSVADLTPSRGFPYLIDAFARLIRAGVDVECTIVGEGPLREVTELWIAEHHLSDRVTLTGALPQHEVAALMGKADIFVFPSVVATDGQMDGIPVSLMEAMAAGNAVIAAPVSGIPELVRQEVNGLLVDATHPDRLAQAIIHLIRDPELRSRLGRAAIETVKKDFDVRHNGTRLIRLLDRHEQPAGGMRTAAERIAAINWSRLQASAVGVRRVHDRGDVFVAEVTISDGKSKRDVIVRQPYGESDDGTSGSSRARAEFETISMLRQTLEQNSETAYGGTRYTIPHLLIFDEPNDALIFERADGQSLAGALGTSRADEAARKAGTWLRLLQTQTRSEEDGVHVLTAVVILALRDLDLVAAGDRTISRRHAAIAEKLQALETKRASGGVPSVGRHGDYRAENIFVGERRVDVTGFDRFREGLPLEDVARFLIDLELRPLRRRAALRAAFLAGYGLPVQPEALQLATAAASLDLLANGGVTSPGRRKALARILLRSLSA